jgi:hypothetical protein
MKAHTPGPWAAEYVGDSGGENPVEVWEVVSSNGFSRVAEHMSAEDARLVAFAPDLLAAMQSLLADYVAGANSGDWGNWNPEQQQVVIAARAAIAKATEAL